MSTQYHRVKLVPSIGNWVNTSLPNNSNLHTRSRGYSLERKTGVLYIITYTKQTLFIFGLKFVTEQEVKNYMQ